MIRSFYAPIIAAMTLFMASPSFGQTSETYYRYFEITTDASVDTEELAEGLFENLPFSVEAGCPARSAILIKVPANYPKRVEKTEEEILEKLQERIPPSSVMGIKTIKATEVENFCQ